MSILSTHQLTKVYGAGATAVRALDSVSLAVETGEFVAVVGTSGSGKSTLLHLLGGLDRPTAGEVLVDGQPIFALKPEALTIFRRRKIGFVFQSYNLVPVLTVRENIALPLELDGRRPDARYWNEVVEVLGLGDKLDRRPNELSGGQQQRVAIGRALITRPALILADEPTGNLDRRNSREVMELLTRAARQYSQTVLMITHNNELAAGADRVLRVTDGVLTDLGGAPQ